MEKVSKSRIEKRMKDKMNPVLVQTIIKLKKTNPVVAKELARPRRKWPSINLKDIDLVEGDVLVAGKILSGGELREGKKIVAWAASEKAIEKIKDAKAKFILITEEVEKNPELNGLKMVK